MTEIGFMQGRLSPLVDGKIQAFPGDCWDTEFDVAGANGFRLMEWTLDHHGLSENPLMTPDGRRKIAALSDRHGVDVASITGDCFMQAPFFKQSGSQRDVLFDELRRILDSCADCGARFLVVPLVDDGRIENETQRDVLLEYLLRLARDMSVSGPAIVFESDFPASALHAFIELLPATAFGINYDVGNSAAAGFDPDEEIAAYGGRILNVHIKDRILGGTTVPLGEGNADFPKVFRALRKAGYGGNHILQTARAADNRHLEALRKYRDMVASWLQDSLRHAA